MDIPTSTRDESTEEYRTSKSRTFPDNRNPWAAGLQRATTRTDHPHNRNYGTCIRLHDFFQHNVASYSIMPFGFLWATHNCKNQLWIILNHHSSEWLRKLSSRTWHPYRFPSPNPPPDCGTGAGLQGDWGPTSGDDGDTIHSVQQIQNTSNVTSMLFLCRKIFRFLKIISYKINCTSSKTRSKNYETYKYNQTVLISLNTRRGSLLAHDTLWIGGKMDILCILRWAGPQVRWHCIYKDLPG